MPRPSKPNERNRNDFEYHHHHDYPATVAVFMNCEALRSLKMPLQAPSIWKNTFQNSPNLTIYIPENSIGYTSDNWIHLNTPILPIPSSGNSYVNDSGGNEIYTVPRKFQTAAPVPAVLILPLTVKDGTASGSADDTLTAGALDEAKKDARAASKEAELTKAALDAVGSRPAYRLSVEYTGEDGRTATVSELEAGSLTAGIAYTPAVNEQTGGLRLIRSRDDGSVEWLDGSGYEAKSGKVTGSTRHLSVYGVGCKPGVDGG